MKPDHLNRTRENVENRSFYTLIETETVPDDAAHWEREHFIPVAQADWRVLMTHLAMDAGLSHDRFEEFCALLDSLVHMRAYHENAELSENYSHLDPDCVNERLQAIEDVTYQECGKKVVKQLDRIMVRANYQKLSRLDLIEALKNASDFGMQMSVNFSGFKRLGVYVRGKVVGKRVRRKMTNFYRKEEVDVPLYQRLVICFQVTEEVGGGEELRHDCLYIKSFKNIPQHDIDMLLPGTKVRMSLVDRSKIVLPTLSGLAILIVRLFFAVSMGLFAFASLMFTTSGYAVKSIFGYLRTKDKYQHNLTKNLYYQNLGNNAGVLQQLQNEAQTQDIQECLLGYTMLLLKHPKGATARALDQSAEAFIQEAVKFPVDFEVDDALNKLVNLKLVRVDRPRIFVAVPLQTGIQHLRTCFTTLINSYSKMFDDEVNSVQDNVTH